MVGMIFIMAKIYFYHIPKTARTSINFTFFCLVCKDPQAFYDKINANGSVKLEGKLYVRDSHHQFNTGNFYYGFSHFRMHTLQIPKDVYTFTCLRDPIERVLSFYRALHYRKKQGQSRPDQKFLGNNLTQFIKQWPRDRLKAQLGMFSQAFDTRQALKNLKRLNKIIIMDHLQDGLSEMGRDLGLSLIMRHENKSHYDVEVTAQEMDVLKRLLKDDYEFYNEAKFLA
jgi:hypothetical protein